MNAVESREATRRCRDHVLIENGGVAVLCTRCGDRQPFPLPMRVETWLAFVRVYTDLHRGCVEKVEGDRA